MHYSRYLIGFEKYKKKNSFKEAAYACTFFVDGWCVFVPFYICFIQAQQFKYKVMFREPDTWWKFKPKELEK